MLSATVNHLLDHLSARSNAAFRCAPHLADWIVVGVSVVGFAFAALPFGTSTGFLRLETTTDPAKYLHCLIVTFFLPCVFEEWIFRVLLLPNPAVDSPAAFAILPLSLSACASLLLFITYHFSPLHTSPVFCDRRFLVLSGVLGVAVTVVYLKTGSVLTAAVAHWIPVAVWLLHFGGLKQMAIEAPRQLFSDSSDEWLLDSDF